MTLSGSALKFENTHAIDHHDVHILDLSPEIHGPNQINLNSIQSMCRTSALTLEGL